MSLSAIAQLQRKFLIELFVYVLIQLLLRNKKCLVGYFCKTTKTFLPDFTLRFFLIPPLNCYVYYVTLCFIRFRPRLRFNLHCEQPQSSRTPVRSASSVGLQTQERSSLKPISKMYSIIVDIYYTLVGYFCNTTKTFLPEFTLRFFLLPPLFA